MTKYNEIKLEDIERNKLFISCDKRGIHHYEY